MDVSLIPAQMDKHHEIILHEKDGSLILGTSNLTGRYWKGSVWHFADSDAAPDIQKCTAGFELESGLCDMKIVNPSKLVVALDSGSLQLLDITKYDNDKDAVSFTEVSESTEHDDVLHSVDVLCDHQKIITGSWDRSIKIWDLQTFIPSFTYKDAHSDVIWMVASHLIEADVFASCSDDGEIRLWDVRLPRPATEIGNGFCNSSPMALAWKPGEDQTLVVGDETGLIHILDVRQNKCLYTDIPAHTRSFRKIEFSSNLSTCFATCAFDSRICVFNLASGNPEQIYKDDSHLDIVRSLSWHPVNFKLYSCSWDSTIRPHTVSIAMETNS